MRTFRSFLLALWMMVSASAWAVNPHMVKDVNTIPATMSSGSSPNNLKSVVLLTPPLSPNSPGAPTPQPHIVFDADNGVDGRELWYYGLFTQKYGMLKDINPGSLSGFSSTTPTGWGGSSLFFSPEASGMGAEPWWSIPPVSKFPSPYPRNRYYSGPFDTACFTDLMPGASSSYPDSFTYVPSTPGSPGYAPGPGTMYFAGSGENSGRELYQIPIGPDGSVGTPAPVSDINPGYAGSYPQNLAAVNDGGNGLLYFAANDGTHGHELWRTNGTPEGTYLVGDLNPGTASSDPQVYPFAQYVDGDTGEDFWLFSANTSTYGVELWRTLGAFTETSIVKDINPGTASSSPAMNQFGRHWDEVNQKYSDYFTADDGTHGREIWVTDGTLDGTQLFYDTNPGSAGSAPQDLVVYGNSLYYTADDGTNGPSLYHCPLTGGSPAPTRLGVQSKGPVSWVGDTGLFVATDPTYGTELFSTDGTPEGTGLFKDIRPGSASSNPQSLVVGEDGKLYFQANDGQNGAELWTSDGTPEGTQMVADINPPLSSTYMDTYSDLNGTLYYSANNSSARIGYELYVSDGTPEGTGLVRDIRPGPSSSYISNMTAVGDTLYFSANDVMSGAELWSSMGAFTETKMVYDLNPGPGGSDPASLYCTSDNTLYFAARDPVNGHEPRMLVPPNNVPVLVKDINPGTGGSLVLGYHEHKGTIYFDADDGVHGSELWKTDGTPENTKMVKDIAPGGTYDSSYPDYFTSVGDTLFFSAYETNDDQELWKTDGTEAGTVKVKDIYPGPTRSRPQYLTHYNGKLYFSADHPNYGRELWTSDGTEEGTTLVKDIWPGSLSSNPALFIVWNDALYFTADDGMHGKEIWRTDGTPEGTFLANDINPDAPSSVPNYLTVYQDHLFFTASDGGSGGYEIWRLQAAKNPGGAHSILRLDEASTTATTARQVSDISPGLHGCSPSRLVVSGDRLYFQAIDITADNPGFELYCFDSWQVPPFAPSNPGAREVTPESIQWTWWDNSLDETAFRLWADEGTTWPLTLRATPAADTTTWTMTGLHPNTVYSFQVAAVGPEGQSDKTDLFTTWTLALVPNAPRVLNPRPDSLDVSIGPGDGNPAHTEYAIAISPIPAGGDLWIQPAGTTGPLSAWQTAAQWEDTRVGGLAPATEYGFHAIARNGAQIPTAPGPAAPGTTTGATGNQQWIAF